MGEHRHWRPAPPVVCARPAPVWCWGRNQMRPAGDRLPRLPALRSPLQVGTGSDWTNVSAGGASTCARRSDATVWCWGLNSNGRLGRRARGPTVPSRFRSAPRLIGRASAHWASMGAELVLTAVPGAGDRTRTTNWETARRPTGSCPSGWAWIPTGLPWQQAGLHTCGTRLDGTLWCWGRNSDGQLGDGTNLNRSSPVRVGTASDWQSVSPGSTHTCGTRVDGSAWCWGYNGQGQIGFPPYSTVPVAVIN